MNSGIKGSRNLLFSFSKVLLLIVLHFYAAPVTRAQEPLRQIGRWSYGSYSNLYFDPLQTHIAYLNSGANVLILNITNPLVPVELSKVNFDQRVNDFYIEGNYLYIGVSRHLYVYSVLNKAAPRLIKDIQVDLYISGIYYYNHILYLSGDEKLVAYSIQNHEAPLFLDEVDLNANVEDLAFSGQMIYAAPRSYGINHLFLINHRHLSNLEASTFALTQDYVNTVEIYENKLIVGSRDSMYILSIEDQQHPQILKTIKTDWLYDFELMDTLLFCSAQGHGVRVYNLKNPLAPQWVINLNATGSVKSRVKLPYLFTIDNENIGLYNISDINKPVSVVSPYNYGGYFSSIAVSKQAVFLAAYARVVILNSTNPADIKKLGTIEKQASYIALSGDYAFLANRWSGWSIVDIRDLSHPVIIVDVPATSRLEYLQVVGNYVYTADWRGGVRIYDISTISRPLEVGYYASGKDVERLLVVGNYVYAYERNYGLKIIDVTNKSAPQAVDSLPLPTPIDDLIGYKNYVYVGGGGGILLNTANPAHPIILKQDFGWWNNPSFEIINDTLLVSSLYQGLFIYQITNPQSPVLLGQFSPPYNVFDVVYGTNRVYVLDYRTGIAILQFQATSAVNSNTVENSMFRVLTNPVKGDLQLEINHPDLSLIQVTCYNLAGVAVYTQPVTNGERNVTISAGLLPGIYFITLTHRQRTYTRKIVVTD